jgi:hypothetical protein
MIGRGLATEDDDYIRCIGTKLTQEAANGKSDASRRAIGAIADKYGPRHLLLLRQCYVWVEQYDDDDEDDHHME